MSLNEDTDRSTARIRVINEEIHVRELRCVVDAPMGRSRRHASSVHSVSSRFGRRRTPQSDTASPTPLRGVADAPMRRRRTGLASPTRPSPLRPILLNISQIRNLKDHLHSAASRDGSEKKKGVLELHHHLQAQD